MTRFASAPPPSGEERRPVPVARAGARASAFFRAAGFDPDRPLVWIVVEPSAPPPRSLLGRITSLSVQVKGLTVGQFPNASLAIGFTAGLLAQRTQGTPQTAARVIQEVAIVIWAYAELVHGVNWFRHGLGLYTLVRTFVALA